MDAIAAMTSFATVVMVDPNPRNRALLSELLGDHGLRIRAVATIEEFDAVLADESDIGLVLVDLHGPRQRVLSWCARLGDRDIPFMAIMSHTDPTIQRACYEAGAVAVLLKPMVPRDLLNLIRNVLGRSLKPRSGL